MVSKLTSRDYRSIRQIYVFYHTALKCFKAIDASLSLVISRDGKLISYSIGLLDTLVLKC